MAEAVDIKMPRKRVDGLVNGQIWTTYSADLCLVVRTIPSLNSSFAVSSRGGGEFTDKCPLLSKCNVPIFSMLMFSTLMFPLVGATVTAPTGEQPVSPQSQSVLVSCKQKVLSAHQ